MTPEQKAWIDGASYEQLLRHFRFAESGDPMFQGEAGTYYAEVMGRRRHEDPGEHVRASKAIGWD